MRYERIGETRSLSLTRENATITRRRTRRTRRIKKNEVKEKNERLRVRTTSRTVAHKENSYSPTGSCERTLIFNNRFSPKEEEEGPLVVAGADISLSLFPSKLSLYMWITWVLFLSRFVRLSLASLFAFPYKNWFYFISIAVLSQNTRKQKTVSLFCPQKLLLPL